MKKSTRIIAAILAFALCLGIVAGTLVSVFADDISTFASTDYVTKSDAFTAVADQSGGGTVTLPMPEGYVSGTTVQIKYILPADVIKEKYADKTFEMNFTDVKLTVKGAFFKDLKDDAKRVEFQIKATEPFKTNPITGAIVDNIRGATDIINNADHKHPVVGPYVYEFLVWVNQEAVYDFNNNIKATIIPQQEFYSSAKNQDKVSFNVYAYMQTNATDARQNNMNAKITDDTGESAFTVQNPGWFFLAADGPGDTTGKLPVLLIVGIIIVVVVIIAVIVILIVVSSKKKTGNSVVDAVETAAPVDKDSASE